MGMTNPGTAETPSPAAQRPATAEIVPAETVRAAASPAAANARSVIRRTELARVKEMNGWSARSAQSTESCVVSGWSSGRMQAKSSSATSLKRKPAGRSAAQVDDVGGLEVEQVDGDPGEPLVEAVDEGGQQGGGQGGEGGDAQGARRSGEVAAEVVDGPVVVSDDRPGGAQEFLAGGGGGEAAGGAVEQAGADGLLDEGDGAAQGGLGLAETVGGGGEAAFVGDADDRPHLVDRDLIYAHGAKMYAILLFDATK
jgi:hypothetical protein